MKWITIKTEDDLPEVPDYYCVRRLLNTGKWIKDGRFIMRIDKETAHRLISENWEWLDESINQEGSLNDWKEKIRYYASHAYYSGAFDRVTNEASEEAFNKWYDRVLAPLLQNELKGDDLESSVRQDEAATLATLSSQTLTQIEQDDLIKRTLYRFRIVYKSNHKEQTVFVIAHSLNEAYGFWEEEMFKPIPELISISSIELPDVAEGGNGASQEKPHSSTDVGNKNKTSNSEATNDPFSEIF